MEFVTHIEINIDFIYNIIWNPISELDYSESQTSFVLI